MTQARIMLTRDCNFKCPYCLNNRLEELGITGIKKVGFDEAVLTLMSFDNINITGGEPLLKFHVLRSLCRNLIGKSIRVYTNGSLLNEKRFTMLIDAGVNRFDIGLHFIGGSDYDKHFPPPDVLGLAKRYPDKFRFLVCEDDMWVFGATLKQLECEIFVWKMDECNTVDDAKFELVGV